MRFVDKAAAWLICLFGIAHLIAGHAALIAPNERRVWFASAGLLLIVTGLANLAAQAHAAPLNSLTGAVGGASVLLIGVLLGLSDPALLLQPQTLILLALGLIVTGRRGRELAFRIKVL